MALQVGASFHFVLLCRTFGCQPLPSFESNGLFCSSKGNTWDKIPSTMPGGRRPHTVCGKMDGAHGDKLVRKTKNFAQIFPTVCDHDHVLFRLS